MDFRNNFEGRKKKPSLRAAIYRKKQRGEYESSSTSSSSNHDDRDNEHWQELLGNNEITDGSDTSQTTSTSNHDQVDVREHNSDSSHGSSSSSSLSPLQHENAEDGRMENNPHQDNIRRMPSPLSSEQNSWIDDDLEELFDTEGEDDADNDEDIFHDAEDDNIDWLNNYQLDDIPEEITFEKLRNLCNSDEANEKIEGLDVSKVEILLAVLKFALVYNLCQSAIADLLKMINCFIGRRFLPETRYIIDQYFNSQSGIEYHAVCPHCKKYIKKFNRETDRVITCTFCDRRISLRDPTYNSYFAIFDVDNEINLFIKENVEYLQSVFAKRLRNYDNFEDLADGKFYQKFIKTLPIHKIFNSVTTTFNSDGSPVFESSKFALWPIQMVINELPFKIRYSKPITCGIWFGKDKPNMNIFLKPSVTYMNKLSNEGIVCNINGVEQRFYVHTVCCCVDSVAQSPMVGFVQYNGYFGCHWCLHPGVYVRSNRGGSVKYILLDEQPLKRNEIDTWQHMQLSMQSVHPVFGVKNPSILVHLNTFNVISGFVPDSMHCICLGIAEQFAKYWFDTTNRPYSLSNDHINTIDELVLKIKAPNQISRLSRSMKERKWLKAREFENWILYYSLPVLTSFPHMLVYVKHWSLLIEAFHILNRKSISQNELNRAHSLLQKFVLYTEYYYTTAAMTYNVHQLLHLSQSVANWGPLWSHNGYCFENGNGQLVRKMHAAKSVIYQLCRSVNMIQSELILKEHVSLRPDTVINDYVAYLANKETKNTLKLTNVRYFGAYRPTKLRFIRELRLSDRAVSYRKIVKEGCLYTSHKNIRIRSDNSFAITSNGRYIRIIEFIIDELNRREYTICNFINVENVFEDCRSIHRITDISEYETAVETKTLETICVVVKNNNNNMYICAVPNSYHY